MENPLFIHRLPKKPFSFMILFSRVDARTILGRASQDDDHDDRIRRGIAGVQRWACGDPGSEANQQRAFSRRGPYLLWQQHTQNPGVGDLGVSSVTVIPSVKESESNDDFGGWEYGFDNYPHAVEV